MITCLVLSNEFYYSSIAHVKQNEMRFTSILLALTFEIIQVGRIFQCYRFFYHKKITEIYNNELKINNIL